jgi:hypothetical protein
MPKASGIKIPAAAQRIINSEIVREFGSWWRKHLDLNFTEAASKFNREVVKQNAHTEAPKTK